MRRLALSAVCCSVILCGVALAQDRLGQMLPSDQAVARFGLVRRWYSFAPVDGARERVQQIMVVGDQLHLQTNTSRIHAMDVETGKLLWSAQLGDPIPGQYGSATNSNSVFAVSGSRLYRLNRDNGSQLWSIRLPQAPNAAPSADEDHVMVSTLDGRLFVFNVNTKEVVWFYQTNGAIAMPAALLDDKIACASKDGKMYVFQPSSRNPTLRYQTEAPVSAPLAVWGRTVLLPSQDFNLYSVDVRNGDTMWRYSSGSEIRRPVAVVENDAYVAPEDGGLHALNAETGTRLWRNPRAQEFVAASKSKVYAADKFGQMLILDRSNGRQLGAWDTHEFEYRARNETSDRLFLVSKSGLVVCLHEKENMAPVVHQRVAPPPPGGIEAGGKSATGT